MKTKTALSLFVVVSFVLIIAHCNRSPSTRGVEESAFRPHCDPFQEVSCEDYGPSGKLICSCQLSSQYQCDPLVSRACPNGQFCNDSGICMPPDFAVSGPS
jgi:hypothetical protein